MTVVDEGALQAIAQYVRARRGGMTVVDAAGRAKLSPRKWHKIEAGQGPHRETTLIRVAKGLGESPARLFELAELPYVEDGPGESSIEHRLHRLEEVVATFDGRLEENQRLLRQLSETVELLSTPRSGARRGQGSKR